MLTLILKKQKLRTGLLIGIITILIAAGFIFIEMEIVHNRRVSISNYNTQQQQLTDQVALRMEYYMNSGGYEISEAIDKIASEVTTSGSRYWFIAKEEQLLFVKDKASAQLFKNIPLGTFFEENTADRTQISSSSFSFDGDKYTIGICTKQNYIEEEGQLIRHQVYLMLPLILIIPFFLVIIIFFVLKYNRQENIIKQLKEEAMDRNRTIEQLSARIKKSRLNDLKETGRELQENDIIIYDKEVLAALFDKMKNETVTPLIIIIIEFKSDAAVEEDYKRDLRKAAKLLNRECVLAEIAPDIFTFLIFHTQKEQTGEIREALINQWVVPLRKRGIMIKMGITCIEGQDTDIETAFHAVCEKVVPATT